jgi:hypothetical protein
VRRDPDLEFSRTNWDAEGRTSVNYSIKTQRQKTEYQEQEAQGGITPTKPENLCGKSPSRLTPNDGPKNLVDNFHPFSRIMKYYFLNCF